MYLKTLIPCLLLFLFSSNETAFAQTANSETNYIYAEGGIRYSGTGKHKETYISFGDKYEAKVPEREEIENTCSKFENGVDMLNFMNDKGWECFDTQIILSTYVTFYMYYFRKPKP